ncbi:MAG: outer membrane beta-barrel protein [Bauldia sp.]
MQKMIAAAITAATLACGPAMAAGSWSGWYAGVNAGGVAQGSCNTLTPQGEWPSFNGIIIAAPDDFDFFGPFGTGCAHSSGLTGGVQVGANMQSGNFVFGVEADLDALSGTSTRTADGTFPSGPAATLSERSSTPWMATIRPRVGVLVNDNLLVYLTGGLAIAGLNADYAAHYFDPGPTPRADAYGTLSTVVPGWTIGLGGEMQLGGNWSLKGEYLHTELGGASYNSFYTPLGGFAPYFTENIAVGSHHVDTFRLGLNYKLGEPFAPATSASSGGATDWRGAYAGVYGGGSWGTSQATEVDLGDGPDNAIGDTFTAHAGGPAGGVEAGYNWQSGTTVAGIEGDVGYLGFKGSASSSLDSETVVSSTGGLSASLRGRLGVTVGRSLFYATGGLLLADLNSTVTDAILDYSGPSSNLIFTSHAGTRAGWTLGGGVEMAMADGWSVKGEYLFYDLGTTRVSGLLMNPGAGTPSYGWDIADAGSTLRVGPEQAVLIPAVAPPAAADSGGIGRQAVPPGPPSSPASLRATARAAASCDQKPKNTPLRRQF